MSTKWTAVTEMGDIGMSFQQLLAENIQVTPTDTEQKTLRKS